jgi:hypothetical protein
MRGGGGGFAINIARCFVYHIYNTHTVTVVLQMYSLEMDTEAVFASVSRHGVLVLYQHTHFPVFWFSFMGNREIKRTDEQPDATFPCCSKRIDRRVSGTGQVVLGLSISRGAWFVKASVYMILISSPPLPPPSLHQSSGICTLMLIL